MSAESVEGPGPDDAINEDTWRELRKRHTTDWKTEVPSGHVVVWLTRRPSVRARARTLTQALWMLSQKVEYDE